MVLFMMKNKHIYIYINKKLNKYIECNACNAFLGGPLAGEAYPCDGDYLFFTDLWRS